MTPLTKETIESSSSTAESAAPRIASPAPASSHLRSDAVSLEIPVKVHGSRITEVVRSVTPHTEPFEEQTTTMIVFAQGGVLKMSTSVTIGQMMVLTNLKTRQDVICRVLKVRNNPNLQAYVEVEFTHPQPGYWGVFFPSDGPEFAPRSASTVQSLNLEPGIKEKTSQQDVSRPFAPAPNRATSAPAKPSTALAGTVAPPSPAAKSPAPTPYVAPALKPESAFISIGSKEDVQVAASSTLSAKKAPSPEIVRENRAVNVSNIAPMKPSESEFPEAPVAASVSIAELQGDALPGPVTRSVEMEHQPHPSVSVEPSAANSRSTFGAFGSGTASASPREIFGSSLGMSGDAAPAHGAESRKNWILIAACAAFAVVAVGGGAMYFRQTHTGSATTNPVSAAVPAPAPAQASAPDVSQNVVTQTSPSAIPPAPTNPAASAVSTTATPNSARVGKVIVTDHTEPNLASSQPAPSMSSKVMAGTLNARPVTPQRASENQAQAPALDAGIFSPGPSGSLPGISASPSALPPPPPPTDPIRLGGSFKEPKLISSVSPVYPATARQAMVDGDVVIHAVIDPQGKVSQAEVISGPEMLRQAALTAVRQWKYAPSVLDGQPVSVETTVTIKFRR